MHVLLLGNAAIVERERTHPRQRPPGDGAGGPGEPGRPLGARRPSGRRAVGRGSAGDGAEHLAGARLRPAPAHRRWCDRQRPRYLLLLRRAVGRRRAALRAAGSAGRRSRGRASRRGGTTAACGAEPLSWRPPRGRPHPSGSRDRARAAPSALRDSAPRPGRRRPRARTSPARGRGADGRGCRATVRRRGRGPSRPCPLPLGCAGRGPRGVRRSGTSPARGPRPRPRRAGTGPAATDPASRRVAGSCSAIQRCLACSARAPR